MQAGEAVGLEESCMQPSHCGTNRSSVLAGGKMLLSELSGLSVSPGTLSVL